MVEPATKPVEILNRDGRGPVLLVCEHASNRIPAEWGDLGLDAAARDSHAAWDPGAEALATLLAQALDAPLVAGRVSRLVYDCNRPPDDPSAMSTRTETITVPGNAWLDDAARAARVRAVYTPFTETLAAQIDRRRAQGTPCALVTVHSFSPTWFGVAREEEIGILHDADSRLADAMLALAPFLPHRHIARNAPYGPEDGVTHTLRLHGLENGLPNVMLELRNDLLRTDNARNAIADEVLALLRPALAALMPREAQDA